MLESMATEGARGKEDLIEITKTYEAKVSKLIDENSRLEAEGKRREG